VSHHGYVRTTADVDLLVTEKEATALSRKLKGMLGWTRYAEGFRNTVLEVGLDLCVEGRRTSPRWREVYPALQTIRRVSVRPIPVIALPDLVALKAMSGRLQDDADIGGLLKAHPSRAASLHAAAARRLRTPEAREHLDALVRRIREELGRRR
jgi:hypothetical protein